MSSGGMNMAGIFVLIFGVVLLIGIAFLFMTLIFGSKKHDDDDPEDRIGF